MLVLATVNRVLATPAPAAGTDEKPVRHALRHLRRNVASEIVAGAVVLVVVAVLGLTPPGVAE